MDGLQVDHGFLFHGQQEEAVLPVLQEEVLGVASGDLAAQRLRIGDGEERRMRDGFCLDPEPVEIGEQLVWGGGHDGSGRFFPGDATALVKNRARRNGTLRSDPPRWPRQVVAEIPFARRYPVRRR